MVVLESDSMLPSTNNQYLQPDYLSSLPTTLDAKKSPLALLAQTCSQIGVDPSNNKPLNSPHDKFKKAPEPVRSSSTENKLGFKSTEKTSNSKKTSVNRVKSGAKNYTDEKIERHTPEVKIASPSSSTCGTPTYEFMKALPEGKSENSPTGSVSPTIKPGIDIFHENSKDSIPTSVGLSNNNNSSLSSCYAGMEQLNPAFRSFPGYNSGLSTGLYNSGYSPASNGPYSNYYRVKTPSGEALVPACKEPYCTGCQYNLHNPSLLINNMSGTCPSGCTQCDHQKYNLAMGMHFSPSTVPSSLSYSSLVRPYVCNWISGEAYCGKRFVSSEELLQHLRSHTAGLETTSTATSSPSLLNPLAAYTSTSLHRPSYLNSVNHLSSMRYHPYNKVALQTLIGSYSAFSPTVFGSYYSPYSVYGQRIGAATVHP